jgi:hypothetical protein
VALSMEVSCRVDGRGEKTQEGRAFWGAAFSRTMLI